MAFFTWTGNFILGGGGGGGTDNDAIHDNVPGEIAAITSKGSPVAADLLIIEDSAAVDAKKSIAIGAIPVAPGQLESGIDAAKVGDGSVINGQFNLSPGNFATGWLSGGTLSINAIDNTTFDISAGTGVIVDRSSITNPIYIPISWTSFVGVAVPDIATQLTSSVFVNAASGIDVRGPEDRLDPEQYRDAISIGFLVHTNLTNLGGVTNNACPTQDPQAIADLAFALGPITESGIVYSDAGNNNLQVKQSAGIAFGIGASTKTTPKTPNKVVVSASNPVPGFQYVFQDGGGSFTGFIATIIDPDRRDNGSGTLVNVSNNKFTVQRLFRTSTASFFMYGQTEYASMADAEAGLNTDPFNLPPETAQILFRAFLILKEGTADLAVGSNAKFVPAGKISGSSAGSNSTTDFQLTYVNSAIPQVLVDAVNGAMTYRDASTPIGTILQVQNNAGSSTFFAVSPAGIIGTLATVSQPNINIAASQTNSGTFADARISQGSVTQHEAALALTSAQTTSGTFADARISQSSVTQHQAAIALTALLGYVANEHIDWTSTGESLATIGNVTADVLIGGTGTALLPSHSISGDPNTGMYSSADDTLDWATNGLKRLSLGLGGDLVLNTTANGVIKMEVINTSSGSASNANFNVQSDGGTCFLFKNSTTNTIFGGTDTFNVLNESGGVYLTPGATAWSAVSDMRHKIKVRSIGRVSGKVKLLDIFFYRNKGAHERERGRGWGTLHIGMSAQEVFPVFPQIVTGTPSTKMGIMYDKVGVIALKAGQEHLELIEAQGKLIRSLTRTVENLVGRIATLEANLA
jgi:hypothetical protein